MKPNFGGFETRLKFIKFGLWFLRHVPVVYVDYPGETSLKQIYGTFNRAMLRMIPTLRTFAEPLTNAMVDNIYFIILCHLFIF